MKSQAPTMMKALMLEGPNKFSVVEVPIPKPADGEVLIKVMAAPINPSDLIFIDKAVYANGKKTPCVPGFQGSGIVVENGGGLIGWSLVNKKVAFSPSISTGSYAQYAIASSTQCMSVDEALSFQHASMSFVNPMTAVAMLDILKSKSVKGVILTAAASALGRMLNRLLPPQGIRIINIIRRQEQIEILKKQGATHILNSSTENFQNQLTQLATDFNATICFDAIGGDFTGKVLKCMPKYSSIYVYGVLSGQNINNVDVGDILVNHKIVTGLFLPNWMETKGTLRLLPTMLKLRKWLMRELKSNISKEFSLDNFGSAAKFYQENMTKGKVVIKPWMIENNQQKKEQKQSASIKQVSELKKVESTEQKEPKSKQVNVETKKIEQKSKQQEQKVEQNQQKPQNQVTQ